MADRSIASRSLLIATLQYSGTARNGATKDETRTLTGLTVTNNTAVSQGVEVTEDATGRIFEATIAPGETKEVTVRAFEQYWNPDAKLAGPRWEGVTIRWKEPA